METGSDGREKPANLREMLRFGEAYLAERGIADASVDAWLLLEYVTKLDRAQYLARASEPLEAVCERLQAVKKPGSDCLERLAGGPGVGKEADSADQRKAAVRAGTEARSKAAEIVRRYREALERRGAHIPLQHLTGEQEFMGLPFLVNGQVLIPRQDTETLVEEALARLRPGMRVLDLCTGSGCIAVSLAKLGPEYLARKAVRNKNDEIAGQELRVDASDVSPEALAVARENARRLSVQLRFVESDLFAGVEEAYDMIVSNPPYIRTSVIAELSEEVRRYEPSLALDGSEDGLYFYREIVRQSPAHLTEGGRLLFEIGYDQAETVRGLMEKAGFAEVEVIRDLAGNDRVAVGKWTRRHSGRK